MKAFKALELHVKPDKKEPQYWIELTPEFEEWFEEDREYVKELEYRVCGAFVDTLVQAYKEEPVHKEIGIANVDVGLMDSGQIHIIFGDRAYLDSIRNQMTAEQKKDYDQAKNKCIDEIGAAVRKMINRIKH